MNTSWCKEYLNSELDSWDETNFKKYSLNDNDIFLAWWVTGDIQRDEYSTNEILEFIQEAKKDIQGEFRGNSCRALFSKNEVIISKPISNEKHIYSIDEVEKLIQEWKEQI